MAKNKFFDSLYVLVIVAVLLAAAIAFADTYATRLVWNVPSNVSHSLTYSANCSGGIFYFDERDANFDPDVDGNAGRIFPHGNADATTNDAVCQTTAISPILITNTGSVDINVQVDFNANPQAGVNVKLWLGTDTGCGTAGLGGWEQSCSAVVNDVNMITTTVCKDRNSVDATNARNIIKNLFTTDTNQLCLTSDFTSVTSGQYSADMNTVGVQA